MENEKTRLKAVVVYRATGNNGITAQQCGVDPATIRSWRKSDWWKQLEDELKLENRVQLSGKLQKIVDKAMIELEDRLSEGDWFYDQKLGKMLRKPVNAATVNQIIKDQVTQQREIEKAAERTTGGTEKVQDVLSRLAVEFERFAKMRLVEATVERVERPTPEALESPTSPDQP